MVWPTIIAAAANFAGSYFANKGSRSKAKKPKQIPNMTPEAAQFYKDYVNQARGMQGGANQAQGILTQFLNPESEAYRNFEAPYLQNFQDYVIPNLAERFAGAGGGLGAQGGALSSSGFGQALGAAGGKLTTDLAAMKENMRMSAAQSILNNQNQMAQTAFGQQPFSYLNREKGASPWQTGAAGFFNNITPGSVQGAFDSIPGLGKSSGGPGYNAQYPLTNAYDQYFRSGAAY